MNGMAADGARNPKSVWARLGSQRTGGKLALKEEGKQMTDGSLHEWSPVFKGRRRVRGDQLRISPATRWQLFLPSCAMLT
jgi:hypothetical protein